MRDRRKFRHATGRCRIGGIEEPLAQNLGIHTRRGDGRSGANDNDRRQGEQHAGAEFGNFENICERADHIISREGLVFST